MDILEKLNDKQAEAATKIDGPLLILAGAGSGKTRVITNRTAYMIKEKGINPFNILAITFTNKAAGEMRQRIDDIVGFGADSIWVATFHSTCARILRRHIDRIGYDTNFTIYDTDDQKAVIKEIVKRFNINTKMMPERAFMSAISHAKDELTSPEMMALDAMGDYSLQLISKVYLEYQAVLRRNNALDFDDLICKTVELFKSCPEVLENYQERFKYIMVDEYQDTNTAQFEFIRLLADKYKNICVVGDDDQSIYKFRGANIRNILDFESHYPDALVVKLEQNYRSTQTILDAANAVISNNFGRKDKSLFTDKGSGDRVHLRQFETAYEEAEFIASDIKKKVNDGTNNYRDNAILYRTNAQSRLLEEKLIMLGIPYNVVGGINFYSRKEIKDVLAYLKTIDNGLDDLAVRRIINVPKRGIGPTTVGRIQEYADANNLSLYDAMSFVQKIDGVGRSASKIEDFVDMIQVLRTRAKNLPLDEIVRDVLDRTKYISELEESSEEDAEDRIENIEEFINKAVVFSEEKEGATLTEFLQEVSLVADIDSVDRDDNRVLLMTLHSAKGLEFPSVYLAGLEDGLFPSYMTISSDSPDELEEERRLCYVGITRAMDDLTLTYAKSRMVRGEMHYNAVSRFVKEIPVLLMDNKLPSPPKSMMYDEPVREVRKPVVKPYAAVPVLGKDMGTKPGELSYDVGDRVSHIKFGQGTVKNIADGGRDFEVTVEFDKAGIKKMFAAFAKLKKI
ncbi:MAG: 3'-5' exonuclease [Lachnospiraceae bacterium]|nr:3'-5' exonuclease [Lachnospiraceae bacterium]